MNVFLRFRNQETFVFSHLPCPHKRNPLQNAVVSRTLRFVGVRGEKRKHLDYEHKILQQFNSHSLECSFSVGFGNTENLDRTFLPCFFLSLFVIWNSSHQEILVRSPGLLKRYSWLHYFFPRTLTHVLPLKYICTTQYFYQGFAVGSFLLAWYNLISIAEETTGVMQKVFISDFCGMEKVPFWSTPVSVMNLHLLDNT